jgi:uncharacterized protein
VSPPELIGPEASVRQRRQRPPAPLSIAVIGSGMAGLAAAWRCRQAGYDVTVFEARSGHGMDAHGHRVHDAVVDVPLRVMSPTRWHRVLTLADEVGVGTFDVDTFVSCSLPDRRAWFRSARMPVTGLHFVGSLRSLDLRAARIGAAALHLAQRLRTLKRDASDMTLADLLAGERFDPLFWRGLLLPLLITICTCEEDDLLRWPAAQLLSLLDDLVNGASLVRLRGGTTALVDALARGLRCHSGSPVVHVGDEATQVRVRNARGDEGLFDRVIIATQANQLGFLRGARYARERQRLKAIRYASGELVVHGDERFMPVDRRDWVALNFRTDAALQRPMFTVWVNAVEPTLVDQPPVFQTWNPQFAPRRVLAKAPLQRALVDGATAGVLQALDTWHAEPQRRVFYCGSWAHAGVPLLETAVRSAEHVVACIREQDRSPHARAPAID